MSFKLIISACDGDGGPGPVEAGFLNLGSNAIKFTEKGGQITLNLSVSGNWVEVEMIDHGPGIPKEELVISLSGFIGG